MPEYQHPAHFAGDTFAEISGGNNGGKNNIHDTFRMTGGTQITVLLPEHDQST